MANAVTASYANDAYDPLRNYLAAMQRDDDLMDGVLVACAKHLLMEMERQIDAAAPVLPIRHPNDAAMLSSARQMIPED